MRLGMRNAKPGKAGHPDVMERGVLDHVLCKRMNWKLDGKGAAEAMIAVAKFKVMASHAHEAVAARQAGKPRKKFVAESAHQPSTRPPVARRAHKSIADGMKLLKMRLDFLKLEIVEMEGDGNCQFRAFSNELFGTQEFHLAVRAVAVDWLTRHADDFSFFVGEEKEWQDYLRKMAQPCTWGDELTLRATCDAFGVVVHLITTEHEHWHEQYDPAKPRAPARHVFLAYISPVHYNTVAIMPGTN